MSGWGYLFPKNKSSRSLCSSPGSSTGQGSGIQSITIVGDSKSTINYVRLRNHPTNGYLKAIFQQIHLEIQDFSSINHFHVLKNNNKDVD